MRLNRKSQITGDREEKLIQYAKKALQDLQKLHISIN